MTKLFGTGSKQSVTTSRPTVHNKVLEADYYRGLEADKAVRAAKKPKPKRPYLVIDDRVREIAADLRKHTVGYVVMKHNVSTITLDKIRGEMSLGNI
jgi:hypothetical protein